MLRHVRNSYGSFYLLIAKGSPILRRRFLERDWEEYEPPEYFWDTIESMNHITELMVQEQHESIYDEAFLFK